MIDGHDHILTPLAYRHIFDQALTAVEVHRWQYRRAGSLTQVRGWLEKLVRKGMIYHTAPFFHLKPKIDIKVQQQKRQQAKAKLTIAQSLIKMTKLPDDIIFVGLSGSVAAGFCDPDDDIDWVIITRPDSLWFSRLRFYFANPNLPRRRPGQSHNLSNRLCLNLWLTADNLKFPPNIFFAHELLNVVPLYDPANFYPYWLEQNSWLKSFFPLVYKLKLGGLSSSDLNFNKPAWPVRVINRLAYLGQRLYMLPKRTNEKVSYQQAFFHTTDHSLAIIKQFKALMSRK